MGTVLGWIPLILGSLIALGVAILAAKRFVRWHSCGNLAAALGLVKRQEPTVEPGRPERADLKPTEDTVALAEFWLKLRSAAEQRANWYYVALFAGLAALLTGYDKLGRAPMAGLILILAMGVGGVIGGFSIALAHLYDVGRINRIGFSLERTLDSERLGLSQGEYLMSTGIAEGVATAGTVYLFLMIWLALQLTVLWQESPCL